MLVVLALTCALVAGAMAGVYGIHAAGQSSISVSPQTTSRIWYHPTPVIITINSNSFSGPGQTPISGYQYGLQWNPSVLQWVSGPNPTVGPGTPTPKPILPCGQQVITWGTPSPTPTGQFPTFTPTPTNTPGVGTPTNTFTATSTPSKTPTPGGYIQVGCASISASTPIPNGVIGTFTFLPIATAQASSALNLINVKALDHNGNPVVPMITAVSGSVLLAECHDVNGDGRVNILDLSLLAAHYNAQMGQPGYVAAYDVNGDGRINIIDLSLVAAGYGQTC